MVSMSGQVLGTDLQVMVRVQLPKLAVYHIEMFIREIVRHFIDVSLVLERSEGLEKVTSPQFTCSDPTIPILVHHIEDSPYHLGGQQTTAHT